MLTSPDFKELLNTLGKHRVRYLVVGGYAVMKYTEPRFTKDLDLWISTDEENSKAVFSALKAFGAPLKGTQYSWVSVIFRNFLLTRSSFRASFTYTGIPS